MKSFKEIGLGKELVAAVEALGFVNPTPIQEQAIEQILTSDRDLIALAQTGTGKTAAFGLPIIQKINARINTVQVIILCPTRELCLQITKDITSYIKNSQGLKVTAVFGGDSMTRQVKEIKRGTNMIVGTPGRVRDLINRKSLNLGSVKFLVLDEADEMLDMGFKEELDAILSTTPKQKQTLLFSATMPSTVRRIANLYMKDPMEISTGAENKSAENVSHEYYVVHARDRYEALRRILDSLPNVYGILFCRTRSETQEVATKLIRDRYKAEAIHGDVAQAQRTRIMESFRHKHIQLLVATDVAARGIDVKGLTHIINYNLPDSDETYIHRSGRTGRAQESGVSVSIINTRERHRMGDIARKTGKVFKSKQVPSGKDVCERQLLSIIQEIVETKVDDSLIADYLPKIMEKLSDFDKESLIKHMVAKEFNYFLNLYQGAGDLNQTGGAERQERLASNFSVFKINFGRKDNFTVKDVLSLINSKTDLRGVEIGRIELQQAESYFELDQTFEERVLKLFTKSNFKGRPIKLELAAAMPQRARRDFGHRGFGGNKFGHKNKRPGGRERPNRRFSGPRH